MPLQCNYSMRDDGDDHEDILKWSQNVARHITEDPVSVTFNDPEGRCEDANSQVGSADICNQKIA